MPSNGASVTVVWLI